MFHQTFSKRSFTIDKRLFVLAITSFLVAGSCMLQFDKPLKNELAPLGIISFELAKTLENSTQILTSWETTEGAMLAAERSLWFDYVFIITYVLLLCIAVIYVRNICWKFPERLAYRFGTVLMRMVIFAGFLDMVENFALLQLFYGDLQSHWSQLAFATALIKFICLFLGIIYVLFSGIVYGIKKRTYVKQ